MGMSSKESQNTASNILLAKKCWDFLIIDSHELIRANRPDSRCKSPGHVSS